MSAVLRDWADLAPSSITRVNSGSAIEAELYNFVRAPRLSAQKSPEEVRLDALSALKADWDGRGSPRTMDQAVSVARESLVNLRTAVAETRSPWQQPHISASELGEVTFEWWKGHRKITLYFGNGTAGFIRVWGPHIFEQMESGDLQGSGFASHWLWLNEP